MAKSKKKFSYSWVYDCLKQMRMCFIYEQSAKDDLSQWIVFSPHLNSRVLLLLRKKMFQITAFSFFDHISLHWSCVLLYHVLQTIILWIMLWVVKHITRFSKRICESPELEVNEVNQVYVKLPKFNYFVSILEVCLSFINIFHICNIIVSNFI